MISRGDSIVGLCTSFQSVGQCGYERATELFNDQLSTEDKEAWREHAPQKPHPIDPYPVDSRDVPVYTLAPPMRPPPTENSSSRRVIISIKIDMIRCVFWLLLESVSYNGSQQILFTPYVLNKVNDWRNYRIIHELRAV